MIKNKDSVSLIEVKEILSEYPQAEENKRAEAVLTYIKKFAKVKSEKGNDLQKAIEELDLAKLKKHTRGPKKPKPRRQRSRRVTHVATARILAQRKARSK